MATHKALPLGGSAGLNFDVVGGTTAPTNPKDNTIWVNTSTPIHHWSLNGKEPYKVSNNKNLLVYPFYQTTGTWNGITYTASSDGSLTVNGTATQDTYFFFRGKDVNDALPIPKGTYTVSGCPSGGLYGSTYSLEFGVSYNNCSTWTYAVDYGSGATLSVSNGAVAEVVFVIYSGATVSNLVVKPQLERGSTATSFIKGDATGQVWVKTLNSGGVISFNALKTNAIDTQVRKVYQYTDSGWALRASKIYKNNAYTTINEELVELSTVLTSSGSNSTQTWDCSNADTLTFDYSVTGSWGYWSGTSSISGTANNATISVTLYLSDGTAVFNKSQNYGSLGCSTNSTAYKTLSGSGTVDLSSYTTAQKNGIYMKASTSCSWSSNTNSFSNVDGTMSNAIYY